MKQNAKQDTPQQHQEDLTQALLRAIDLGVGTFLLTDADARILYASQAVLTQMGCTADRILGKPMSAFWIQPNTRTQHIMAELASHQPWQGHLQCKTIDGGHYWEACTITPIPDKDGAVAHLIKTGTVITEETAVRTANDAIDATYQNILDLMTDGYLETDLKGNITFLNASAARIYQRSPEELIGLSYREYMAPDEAKRIHDIFSTVYRTGTSESIIDYEIIGRDGKPVFCETITTLLRDHKGNPSGFGGIIRDITQKHKMAQKLRESEESYRRVMELAPDAITITRVSDGRYFEVNETFCRQTGYARHEVIGRTVNDLNLYVNPDDREQIIHELRTRGRVSRMRVSFFHRDGSLLHDIVSARILPFKGEECILFVATLINPLLDVQNALKESENLQRLIFSAAPDVICLTRLEDGKYIEVNEIFYRRTGFTPQETIGRTAADLNIYADDSDRRKLVAAITAHGRVDNLEVRVRYKDGTISHQLFSARIFEWDGEKCVLVVAKVIDDLKKTQQLLCEREESYLTILNTAPYGIVILRRSDATYALVNDAFCASTGFTRTEVLGRTPDELGIYADPAQRRTMYERLKQDKRVFGLEVDFKTKSGNIYECLISVSPIVHMGEDCFLTVTINISKQKKAQQELERSEESYRTIIESAPYSINILSIPDLTYVAVNDTFCRNLGYSRSEIIGRNGLELGLFKDPRQIEELVARLRRDQRVDGMELACVTKNGELMETLCTITPVRYMGKRCYLSFNMNLTPLKTAQSALRESEARFRTIFQTAADAIFVTDSETGRFLDVNMAACSHLGYSETELLGMGLDHIVHPDHPYRIFIPDYSEALSRPVFFESVHICKDGSHIPVEVNSGMVARSGKPALLSIVRDVSDRKRAEAELAKYRQHLEEMVGERTRELEKTQEVLVKKEKLAVLGQLTATVSHELRNPLGVIRSSSFYLKRRIKPRDDKVSKHIARIDEQVSLCDTIVADLLEYTRGRKVTIVPQMIHSWVQQVVAQEKESKQLDIALEIADALPLVPHDQEKMRRVLINLISNAVQAVQARLEAAGKSGAAYLPQVSVSVGLIQRSVCFQVADNGIGMDEETRRHAFEPLFTTRARGTGIGLAIVSKVVVEHGGRIEMETEPDSGTIVRIFLPCLADSSK